MLNRYVFLLLCFVGVACSPTPTLVLPTATPTSIPQPTEPPIATPTTSTEPAASQIAASVPLNNHSGSPSISEDGRYLVFLSEANNLIPDDTNGQADIFMIDRQGQTITLISRARNGALANGSSSALVISADGNWVVFLSTSNNLVANDSNEWQDLFLYHRESGQIDLISAAADGTPGTFDSSEPTISADGRWIAFASNADNLVPGDNNQIGDIFLYDREAASLQLASTASDGMPGNQFSDLPSLSADGRWLLFWSLADNLVSGAARGVYLKDLATGGVTWLADGFGPTLSADGQWVAYLTNAADQSPDGLMWAVLVERETGQQQVVGPVTTAIHGKPGRELSLSAHGRWLAFWSDFDQAEPPTTASGVEGIRQIYLYDREQANTVLLSANAEGLPGNSSSTSPFVSGDGQWVVFGSFADNLSLQEDQNGGMRDIFLYQRESQMLDLLLVVPASGE